MATKRLRLTDANLKNVPIPDRFQWVLDTKLKGFYAYVYKTGTITFYCKKDRKGRTVVRKLGKDIKASDAQTRFHEEVANIAKGEYDEAPAPDVPLVTLREARDKKLELNSPKSKSGRMNYEDQLFSKNKSGRVIYEDWMDLPLREIRKSMVWERHVQLTKDRGHSAANHSLVALKAVFNFAFDFWEDDQLGGAFRNPCDAVKKNKERKHKPTWNSREDFKTLWAAMDQLPNQEHADWMRLVALTGMRPGTGDKSESGATWLKWEWIDTDRHVMRIPGAFMKNDEPLAIPIVPQVGDILERQHQRLENKYRGAALPWVFTQRGKPSEPLKSPWSSVYVLRKIAGIHLRPHELRHNWQDVAKSLNLSGDIINSLGGWKGQSTREGYGSGDPEDLRPHAARLVNELLRRTKDDYNVVVPIRA